MDKGSMVTDSFRSEQECCAELALVWKYAKEGKGNYYEVDGYLFRRDKILGESSHMGPKKTLERIKYSFFWEGLRADVKKFCESCKECQLTRSVRIKDRSSSTPVARPELPFEVGNIDLIGPIDPPSVKGHKYILRLVDQHTRWGEAVPLTSLSAKVLRMLEQFVISRIVDIDLLMQIWKNRVKRINFVLGWVGSEIILAKGKLEPTIIKTFDCCNYCVFCLWIFCVTVCEFSVPGVLYGKISHKGQILLLGGACKEQPPAPGNRSNERRYRGKDLAKTGEKKVGTGEKREGDEKSRGREK
ncbi:retrovirus-related Pol polyprotein from transposon opus [Trichonephila clavipes]|nr:retrovirus-related Pol polyprotein from transposon opus [Trichonephila clavipes]